MVALVLGRAGGAAGIAAGTRFGEPEAAQHLAAGQQRDIFAALLSGAEFDDGRGSKVGMGADGEPVARVHLGHLVDGHVVGQLVHPGAAELLAPWHAEQSQLTHAPDVLPWKLGVPVQLPGHRLDVFPGKLAHHLAHLELLVGEVEREIHGDRLRA